MPVSRSRQTSRPIKLSKTADHSIRYAGLQKARYDTIDAAAFPVNRPNQKGGHDPGQRPARNVARIMRSDIDAGECDDEGGNQKGEALPTPSMHQKSRRYRKRRGRVIGRKREIAAARNQEVGYASVIRPRTLDEEQDELIQSQPEQERKPGRDEYMSDMPSVASSPPLCGHGENQERNAYCRRPNHQKIGYRIRPRPTVDPAGYRRVELIHWRTTP